MRAESAPYAWPGQERSASYAWTAQPGHRPRWMVRALRARVGKICVDNTPFVALIRQRATRLRDDPPVPRPKRDDLELLRVAAELWDADARDIGYLARLFTQTSLPYRDPGDVPAWGRRNGSLVLVVQPGMTIDAGGTPRSIGYPFGTVPRLLLTWLSTEAVRTKSRELNLGASLADFMRQLDMTPTGGRNGTITRLRKQMERLFQATLSVRWEGEQARE